MEGSRAFASSALYRVSCLLRAYAPATSAEPAAPAWRCLYASPDGSARTLLRNSGLARST